MCSKAASPGRRPPLRTRWNRARARLLAFLDDREARLQDSGTVTELLASSQRWLSKGRRSERLTEAVMNRLEHQLDQLWTVDDWKTRQKNFMIRINSHPKVVEAFDGLIALGCYPDIIVEGVKEVGHPVPPSASAAVRQRARRQIQHLSYALDDLAEVNAAAAARWPPELFSVFHVDLTMFLRDEVQRLNEWADALDLRLQKDVHPRRLTLFLAAVRHTKDVTGAYRDNNFAQIFDGLGVTVAGELVSGETIRKWRQRDRDANRYDPWKPLGDHIRLSWR